jgi:hypothetical protein
VGNDRNNGASTSTPWLTINKVNTSKFNPGDSILFESTCTWREQLTVPSSGSAGSPITFGAYGTGAAPIISGANLFTSWALSSGSVYYTSYSTAPNQVFEDGSRLTQNTTSSASLTAGQWYLDTVDSYIWVYLTAGDNPTGHTIEASQRSSGIVTGALSYVTFTGLHVTKTNGLGFNLGQQKLVNVTVNAVTSDYNYGDGLQACTDASDISTGGIVQNSTFAYNGLTGIGLCYVNNWLIANNIVHHNNWVVSEADTCTGGIYGFGSYTTNVTVEYNDSYQNGLGQLSSAGAGDGIDCDTCGSGIIIAYNNVHGNNWKGINIDADNNVQAYYNLVWNNAHGGIHAFADANTSMTGHQIYNNTLYGNSTFGISVTGPSAGSSPAGCTNNIVSNNIVVGTVGGPNLEAFNGCENPGTDGSGNVYSYNDFGVAASNFIQWGASVYESTYTAWETARGNCGTPGCSHSVQAAPTFANASAGQFWLTGSSPGIGAGTNLGSPYNIGLMPGSTWPNSVVTGDQNAYGSGWEIGAFVYVPALAPPSNLQVVKVN